MFCPNPECPDFVDTGIHSEYVDTIWQCPACGAKLVHELSAPPPPEGKDEPEVVGGDPRSLASIGTYLYHQDAELACTMLTANGITACVFRRELLVPESQLHEAMALLAEADKSS